MKQLIIPGVLLLILSALNLTAQVAQEWVARYNGTSNSDDYAYSIANDISGNVYVTGWSKGIGSGFDYITIKYNSSGIQQWVQRYNGPGNGDDQANSISVDGSGNVYVTGQSIGSGTFFDLATIKYNTSGLLQWVQRYNGSGNAGDGAYALVVDGTGNIYVTGWIMDSENASDYITIKYNSSGIQQWVQIYNGPGNADDISRSIAIDGSGSVYITGQSKQNAYNNDYATIKYNSSGIQQWVQRYHYAQDGNDFAYSIAVDGSGNSYVTGRSYVPTSQWNYATVMYNSAGTQQWVKLYYQPGGHYWSNEYAYSVAVDGSANAYVTGASTNSPGPFDYAYCTIKYTSTGGVQWIARYDNPGVFDDNAYSIAADNSGNVYVTGESGTSGAGFDYATIKYNTSGAEQWVQRYNGPANDSDAAYKVIIDGSGNVYVTGWSRGIGTGYDFATIKYSQMVGIQPISNEIPNSFSLSQNYPNPFNPSTKIRFDIPPLEGDRGRMVRLIIYDILGREIAVIVNEQLSPGTYEVEWGASNYPSGVYMYKLVSDDFTETKKMIFIK